jgi:hypothetical protein
MGSGFMYASALFEGSTICIGNHVMLRCRERPSGTGPRRAGGFQAPEFPRLRFSTVWVGQPSPLLSFAAFVERQNRSAGCADQRRNPVSVNVVLPAGEDIGFLKQWLRERA